MEESLPGWDERTRPAVKTYAASPAELAHGDHLRMIHDHYRHELEQVGRLMDRVADGSGEVGAARAAIHATGMLSTVRDLGSLCGRLCQALGMHHRVEDAFIYPALRAADGDLSAVLDQLYEEHDVVHELLEVLDAALVDHVRGSLPATDVQRIYRHFRSLLESHFAYEEAAIGAAIGVHRIMA